jgi:hypothetical protein
MIFGLLGVAGAGKDTAGAVLARELGGTCIAFADPMKRFCMAALGLTEAQLWSDKKEAPILRRQLRALKPKKGKVRLVFNHGAFPTPWIDLLEKACGGGHVWLGMLRQDREKEIRAWWDGIKDEKGLTPRRVLQTFGTEFGRKYLGEDFWVKCGLETAWQVLSGKYVYSRHGGLTANEGGTIRTKDAVIFTDVRFRNEVIALKRRGAKVFRIQKMAIMKRTDTLDFTAKAHTSETEQSSIPSFWTDGVFMNYEGKKEEYERGVAIFAQDLIRIGARSRV